MIWLVWRQHRKQALFTLAALAALGALMVPTGLAMHAKYDSLGLGACRAALGNASLITQTEAVSRCESLGHQFQQEFGGVVFIAVLFVVLPVLVGVFFGAPLVAREVEQGTHRLVWTQGVTRLQWALAKFGLVGAMTTVLSVGYALGVSWWFRPLVSASTGRLNYLSFDVQGIVPIAYTLFALALGVFAGTRWRKVLPAMGIALVGFAAVRVAIEVLARPRYLPAQSLTFSPTGGQTPNPASGNWVMDVGVRNAAGDLVLPNAQLGPCPPGGCGDDSAGPGAANWLQYQPGDRFWLFQGIETGIFVLLAAALVFFALRRLRTIA
ncbi:MULTISPECIES: transporter [unclassified Amycolatopsis]|uniref:ABC transporter permease n=1 Tax=unclassified Amycolatopsis TaxID=2618356 RepID=UPI002874B641|nr:MULTISPECIES: transporter [unclassified Amycolatopsis]MDS0135718.1 transporter [Amycolatopsis sp. 505]MDS0145681.1 transporter [Amycolatopsis sp. CM201R]